MEELSNVGSHTHCFLLIPPPPLFSFISMIPMACDLCNIYMHIYGHIFFAVCKTRRETHKEQAEFCAVRGWVSQIFL